MLASEVRRLLGPALRECPPECGIVSLSEIEVSPDLSYVTAYVTALREPLMALAHLLEHTPELQHRLSALPLQRLPTLRFRLDERGDRASRIDTLLAG